MISRQTKRRLSRIIPFGLIWLIFSIIYSLLERGLLGNLKHYPSTGNPYNFSSTIFITAVTALILGLLVGTTEILYFYKLFRKKSFIKKMVYKTMIYLAIIISFLLINTVIYNSIEIKTSVFNKLVWNNVWSFFSSYAFWGVEVYITAVIGISLFYTEVSDNLV
jgi:adenylate cyclase